MPDREITMIENDRLQWKRANEQSKDLSIINIHAFRKEIYLRLSDNFLSDAVNSINRHFYQVLQFLPETGNFPSGQKRNSGSVFNRNGYMNLYRWCVTDNPRFARANRAATALWEFLFGDLPRRLAEAGGNDGNDIITEEKVWNDWYAGLNYIRNELNQPVPEPAYEENHNGSFFPEEVRNEKEYYEGATQKITVNIYERNAEARQKCIEHYGTDCYICGFNFEKKYGETGRGFIHVHHLKPLSEIGEKYELNPVQDLRPVCPNCHAMLHKRKPPYSTEELKQIYQR